MNIQKEEIDGLNVIVSVDVSKDDYLPRVNEVLHDYRRKAVVPGFRPGKVPEGLLRKIHGRPVLGAESNKLVSEALLSSINEQQWQLLGEAMPKHNVDDQDWEIGNDYTFLYEMGLAPVMDVQLSKEYRIPKYRIPVDQDMINRNIDTFTARYGQFVDTGAVVDFKERLTGNIIQLDDNRQPLPDGLAADDTTLLLSLIKNEEHKQPFENIKAGDEITFNLAVAFPNKWEILSILKLNNNDELGDLSDSLFRFTVRSVQQYTKAELNQELFDKLYGEGVVTSLEEFENRIREDLSAEFEESCMARFGIDAREYLLQTINPPLPEEFLRRWLKISLKELDEATLEKDLPDYLTNMKWDMIAADISKKKDLQVTNQEIIDLAKANTRQQFAMYGITNVPDETLAAYALEGLKNENNLRELSTLVLGKKIARAIHDAVDLDMRELNIDEFNKLVYTTNNEPKTETVGEEVTETEQTGIQTI
jgi:trigger factor